jgi:hypothetical protein
VEFLKDRIFLTRLQPSASFVRSNAYPYTRGITHFTLQTHKLPFIAASIGVTVIIHTVGATLTHQLYEQTKLKYMFPIYLSDPIDQTSWSFVAL